jgi:hypothetical protein
LKFLLLLLYLFFMVLHLPGTCLHPTDENRRVAERIAALEKVSKDTIFGLTRGTAVLSFFYKIVLSTLGRLLMVANEP